MENLQLLAPGKSRTDGTMACGMILSGKAFAEFSDEERRAIWSRMQGFDGLIPSLYTFFEDFKYLEACAHCVKRLCGPIDMSIWRTMSSIFKPPEEPATPGAADSLIQTSESTFRRQPAAEMERLETGYLQIWLYAMRHHTLMPPDPKSDDDLLVKPTRPKPDERAIYEMAELAHQLGFQSPEINALIQSSPDHQIARTALLQARKPHRYRYDGQVFELLVNQIVSCFAKAVPEQPKQPQGLLADSVMKLKTRAGEPQTRTHKQDGPLLFLDRLHADIDVGDNVTSFFVRRCVYFAFFGKSAWLTSSHISTTGHTGPEQPPSPMFVESDAPLADMPAPDHHPSHEGPGERPGQTSEVIEGRQGIASQQSSGSNQEENTRRRERRKFQIRRPVSRWEEETQEEPMEMELEPPNAENLDHLMLDRESPAEENPSSVEPQGPIEPADPAMAVARLSHVSAVSDVSDGRSDCTRVSLEAVPLAGNQDVELAAEAQAFSKDAAIDNRAGTEGEDGREAPESDPDNDQPNLDEYLAHLRRAQEEQEQLEKRLEDERLHEELGELEQSPREKPPQQGDHQYSPSLYSEELPEEAEDVADAAPAQDTASRNALVESSQPETSEPIVEPQLPPPAAKDLRAQASSAANQKSSSSGAAQRSSPDYSEIQLWSLQRGEWKRSDRLQVDPSNPSLLERVAQKYYWKDHSLYDRNLHSLRPNQCFRAATADGSNALFVVHKDEEKKLAEEGRVVKEKELLWMASRALDRVDDGREPRR